MASLRGQTPILRGAAQAGGRAPQRPDAGLCIAALPRSTATEIFDAPDHYYQHQDAGVDIRDIRELQRDGKVPGAFHCPRGMLEFWIDPQSPYHNPQFAQDKRYVFFCAGGLRSALAAQTAQRMGLKPVAHIRGGFGAWKKSGGPVEMPEPRPKG
jgi:rhodanese-related sulfurtransferase